MENEMRSGGQREKPAKPGKPVLKRVLQGLGLFLLIWDLVHRKPKEVCSSGAEPAKNQKQEIEPSAAENSGEQARPHRLPKPTYWPFFAALGLAFIFWGLLTTWVILLAGLLVLATSLFGWINILRHE